jgi:hypothetical protein
VPILNAPSTTPANRSPRRIRHSRQSRRSAAARKLLPRQPASASSKQPVTRFLFG